MLPFIGMWAFLPTSNMSFPCVFFLTYTGLDVSFYVPQNEEKRNLSLGGHVGFDSLPDQLVSKSVTQGFCFNILCVGEYRKVFYSENVCNNMHYALSVIHINAMLELLSCIPNLFINFKLYWISFKQYVWLPEKQQMLFVHSQARLALESQL